MAFKNRFDICRPILLLGLIACLLVATTIGQKNQAPLAINTASILPTDTITSFLSAFRYDPPAAETQLYFFVRNPPSFYRFALQEFLSPPLNENDTIDPNLNTEISANGFIDAVVLDQLYGKFYTAQGNNIWIIDAVSGSVERISLDSSAQSRVGLLHNHIGYFVSGSSQNRLILVTRSANGTITAELLGDRTSVQEPQQRLNPEASYIAATLDPITGLGYFMWVDPIGTITHVDTYPFPVSPDRSVTSFDITDIQVSEAALDPTNRYLYICGNTETTTEIRRYSLDEISTLTSGSPTVNASIILGATGYFCNSLELDLQNGLGFAGVSFQRFATLTRVTIGRREMNLVENTFVRPARGIRTPRRPVDILTLSAQTTINATQIRRQTTGNIAILLTSVDAFSFSYLQACPGDPICSGRGTCQASECLCPITHLPPDCSQLACPPELNCGDTENPQRGRCVNGACLCNPEFTGDLCQTRQCSFNCGGSTNGRCNTTDWTCLCRPRWQGPTCQIPRTPDCSELIDEIECINEIYFDLNGDSVRKCGWCRSGNRTADGEPRAAYCERGNPEGPVYGACPSWHYEKKQEVGLIALAIIFIVVLGLMFLANWISAILVDVEAAKADKLNSEEVRAFWWRDERSNKAWLLYDQFQFISYYLIISVLFPTRIITFIRFFHWSNLGLPLPFYRDDNIYPYRDVEYQPPTAAPPVVTPTFATLGPTAPPTFAGVPTFATPTDVPTTVFTPTDAIPTLVPTDPTVGPSARRLLNYGQYANSIGTEEYNLSTEQVYYAAMFWFAILLFGFTILYLIVAVIIGLICGSMKKSLQRGVHVIMRILILGYFPIMFVSAYHTKGEWSNGRTIAASIITLIVYGLGLPALAFYIVIRPDSPENLFEPDYKLKFGALYATYHFEKAKYCVVHFGFKFVIAILLGFLAFDYADMIDNKHIVVPQILIPVILMIVYIVLLVIMKPYLDHVHMYVEALLWGINAICLLIAFTHINNPSAAGEIVFAILQTIGLVLCIIAFINSWMMMVGAKSLAEFPGKLFSK